MGIQNGGRCLKVLLNDDNCKQWPKSFQEIEDRSSIAHFNLTVRAGQDSRLYVDTSINF